MWFGVSPEGKPVFALPGNPVSSLVCLVRYVAPALVAALGAKAMVDVLSDFAGHPAIAQPSEGVTYANKIDKAEARLDFTQTAEQVERQVRAFAPAPGAFFELAGERFRILAADALPDAGEAGVTLDDALTIACGSGAIRPITIQRAGRPAMDTAALLHGYRIPAGTRLG